MGEQLDVCYTFEEKIEVAQQVPEIKLTAEMLIKLPDDQKQALKQAAGVLF
jgi:hypothetical protein